jgi:hypothetical protein
MSITRVGSTKKFADNWDGAFGRGGGKSGAKKTAAKKAGKKAAKRAKKAAKNAATAPTVRFNKKKTTPAKAVANGKGPGDDETKKSAAKRKSKTGKKRPAPELQMELF